MAKIKLSDPFSYGRLIRFTLPSVVMMVFMSVYCVVDGLFVSNEIGDLALSAVNVAYPPVAMVGAVGFMLGAGGSALVARTLGEGDRELANRYFSMIIYTILVVGGILSVLGYVYMEPLARMVGASDVLMDDCLVYGRILMLGSIPLMLQAAFQNFFVVSEQPHMGLAYALASGITNIFLDYLFIAVMDMGVAGAALATNIGYAVGGVIPLFYFLVPHAGRLQLTRTKLYLRKLGNACSNGLSELMSNVSASFITILYNIQLMKFVGEAGVAAFSVMSYVDFAFVATFLGFSMGSAPIVSFKFGADDRKGLQNIFRKSIVILTVLSLSMVLISELVSRPLSSAFVGYDPDLLRMTMHGFRIFALCYLFSGFNIYSSAFFTALCNGPVSAVLSILRTLFLRGGLVMIFPILFGPDGIWAAVPVAEGVGVVIAAVFIYLYRHQYHYFKESYRSAANRRG